MRNYFKKLLETIVSNFVKIAYSNFEEISVKLIF